MPKIVEVDSRQACSRQCLEPDPAPEVPASERGAVRTREDQMVFAVLREAGQMSAQYGRDQIGESHGSRTRLRLRRPEGEATALQLGEGALYPDGARVEIDVRPA